MKEKKFISVLSAIILSAIFITATACGNIENEGNTDSPQSETVSTAESINTSGAQAQTETDSKENPGVSASASETGNNGEANSNSTVKDNEEDPGSDLFGVWNQINADVNPEYCPTLFLYTNYTFQFTVNLLEGMGLIEGRYEIKGNKVYCYVDKRDFSGFTGDDVTEFALRINSNKLIYEGNTIGMTESGDSFKK